MHVVVVMIAKRSADELFKQYYSTLVFLLPIKDVDFMDELLKHGLLPGDLKIKLESLTVFKERSSYFLDNLIKPGLAVGNNRDFVSLLTVMKSNKHDNVKELAKEIEKEFVVDTKCKIILLLLYTYKTYSYHFLEKTGNRIFHVFVHSSYLVISRLHTYANKRMFCICM